MKVTGILAAAGSRALLVGSATHSAGSILTSVPAVTTTITALADCLVRRAGLDPRNLTQVMDPANPQEIGEALADLAESATDTLLFYYVGHGLIGPGKELHLATRATADLRRGVAAHQALPYPAVREVLSGCRARLLVVGLDCCFSGRAAGPAVTATDDVFDTAWRHGTYVLASAGRHEAAWARPGEPHTAFTGELIRLLTEGDPRGPRDFTLDALYRSLDRSLARQGLPRPRRQAMDHTDTLALAPNRAYRAPVPPELPARTDGPEDFSPYQGLAAFGPQDVRLFFGRNELTEVIRTRTMEEPPDGVPLAVIGPSGSGKSSLLGAGLIPAVREAGRPHLLITPGDDPLKRLAERVSRLSPETDSLAGRLRKEPGVLADMLREVPRSAGRPILIVDQFEEMFTAYADETLRESFVEAICAACRKDGAEGPAATVVVCVRADFYGHCSRYPQLVPALERPVVVGPMTAAQLRDAIEKPAELSDLALQDGLTDLLLRELGATGTATAAGAKASLPLLSHALLATWQHREGRVLTLAGYHATGGIDRAIAGSADAALSRLDDDGRRMARRILPRLVHLQKDVEDTRRVVALPDLLPPPESADHAPARRALDEFVSARLITVDENTVQIAHEALIRAWPQLGAWIDGNRANLLIQQQLLEDAAAWEQHGRDPSYLYTDTRLAAAQTVTAGLEEGDLNELEIDFLNAGVQLGRRRTRITRQVITTLTVLLLVAAAAGVYAFLQGRIAQEQRDVATSQKLSDISNRLTERTLAAQLSLAAYRVSATPEARGALLSTLSRPTPTRITANHAQAYEVAFAPRRGTIAVAYADGTAQLWDVTDRGRPRNLAEVRASSDAVTGVAFSPDGRLLASSAADRTARLWDVTAPGGPATTAVLTGHEDGVNSVAFSPDGRTVATSSSDGTARLWNVSRPDRPEPLSVLRGHTGGVRDVVFSSDGRMLATASRDTTVRLWDISDGRRPRHVSTLKGHVNAVDAVSFSPDGRTLATASEDWGMSLWDISRPSRPARLSTSYPGGDRLYGVRFSPDGTMVVSASADNLAYLWDVTDREKPQILTSLGSHLAEVQKATFSPDGRSLATVSSDGTTRLWDMTNVRAPSAMAALKGHGNAVTALALSADGRIAATGSLDRTARLWNVADPGKATPLATLPEENNTVDGVALSPDGKLLATACACGLGRLWDIGDPAAPKLLATLKSNAIRADAVAFNPDGRLLAMSCGCGSIQVWELSTPKRPTLVFDREVHGDAAWDLAFSPDGRHLATASADRTVTIWDVSDPRHLTLVSTFTAHSIDVNAVTFSSDGRRMATASNDGTAGVWDVSTPSRPRRISTLQGHSAAVKSVSFSPDDRMLATASADQTVRLWQLDETAEPDLWAVLAGHRGTVFTAVFSPRHGTLATASMDTTAQFWSTDVSLAERRICRNSGTSITGNEWRQFLPGASYAAPCGERSP
ncbi:hypothetical protein GCM10010517_46700 [Streptosporangium fragile]|uniref:Novel STAND NTPase 1 domain-containing protein n=1 Tax=Streptosporangium fragile TaxID=46186 RepID=A0ABN3W2Y9_9ACTN